MFSNIGGKIKGLTRVLCWVGIIASVAAGVLCYNWIGLIVIAVGSIFSWLGSFFAYGFGQLIERTEEIAQNTALLRQNTLQGNARDSVKEYKREFFCSACGKKNDAENVFCTGCGTVLSSEREKQATANEN